MANDHDEKSDGLLGDALKKLLSTGITAAFMTEEAIRSRVSDLKLPKEALNALISGATKSKEELMNRVSDEVIRIINKIDFVKEASWFVEEHKFRVTAEVEVLKREPSGGATSADSNISFSVKPKKPIPGNEGDV